MKILTTENTSYNLDKVPETADEVQYCVLDTNNPKNIDFFFVPLILCLLAMVSIYYDEILPVHYQMWNPHIILFPNQLVDEIF